MTPFDILALGITSIGCFLVGYFAGSKSGVKEVQEQAKQAIKEIKKSTVEVGPVMRPSSETVNKWTDKRREEEDEAFKESFLKEHPEMEKEIHEWQNKQTAP